MDHRYKQLARYLCAAVTGYQLGISPATALKRLPEEVGELWYVSAERILDGTLTWPAIRSIVRVGRAASELVH